MSTEAGKTGWIEFDAQTSRGHQVASGRNGDLRFPQGTIRMQAPYFKALGLNIESYFPGTINAKISPPNYQVQRPKVTFRAVKWHPDVPAEDFSFFDVRLLRNGQPEVEGLIYYPHPETKPEHFQKADVLELLLPFISGITMDATIRLAVPREQMLII